MYCDVCTKCIIVDHSGVLKEEDTRLLGVCAKGMYAACVKRRLCDNSCQGQNVSG